MINTYVSKPSEVQAVQYTGYNFDEIKRFVIITSDFRPTKFSYLYPDIFIDFGHYYILVRYGDYVFKNKFGKIVKLSRYDFEDNYEVKK